MNTKGKYYKVIKVVIYKNKFDMDSFDDDIMLSNIVMAKPKTQQAVKKADLKK